MMDALYWRFSRESPDVSNKRYACIGLSNPKSPSNVGSIMRAAGCYGVASVFYTGTRYDRAKDFGGWAKAQPKYFDDGGVFDDIFKKINQ